MKETSQTSKVKTGAVCYIGNAWLNIIYASANSNSAHQNGPEGNDLKRKEYWFWLAGGSSYRG